MNIAMRPSPFSTSPFPTNTALEGVGTGLAAALFGDREAAAKRAEMQARVDALNAQATESTAHAGLYGSQQKGQDGENDANDPNSPLGIDAALRGLYKQPAAPEVAPSIQPQPSTLATSMLPAGYSAPAALPAAAAPAGPAPVGGEVTENTPIDVNGSSDRDEVFRSHLGGFMASMIRGGHAAEAAGLLNAVAAFEGGDSTARRGMIASGHTPGKEFATPDSESGLATVMLWLSIGYIRGRTEHADVQI